MKKSQAGQKMPKSKLKIQNAELCRELLAKISLHSQEVYKELNAVHKQFGNIKLRELEVYSQDSSAQGSLF